MTENLRREVARRLAGLLLIGWAAACQQVPQAPPAGNPAPSEPPPAAAEARDPPAAAASLEGSWRVAVIDGVPLGAQFVLAFRGDSDRLWWEPRCAGMVRDYRIDGGSIWFSRLPQVGPPGTPQVVCAIGLPRRLDEVFRALDAATTVRPVEGNGVHIAGGGHSVTLISR